MSDWTGYCLAGVHGLDFAGQPCDLCTKTKDEQSDPGADLHAELNALRVENRRLTTCLADARFGWDKANEQRSGWCERALHAEREVEQLKAEKERLESWLDQEVATLSRFSAEQEREACRALCVLTSNNSEEGDNDWRNACQVIEGLIVARGPK